MFYNIQSTTYNCLYIKKESGAIGARLLLVNF